jgi:O-antigen ligase
VLRVDRRYTLAHLVTLPIALLVGGVVSFLGGAGVLLVAGVALTLLPLLWPMVALGLLLAVGGVDLSFATGYHKVPLFGGYGLDLSGIRLLSSAAGLTLLVLTQRPANWRIPWRWLGLFGAFLAYGALSLLWSPSVLDGLRLMLKVAFPVLMFLAILVTARSQHDVDQLIAAAVLGGFLVAVVLNPLLAAGGGFERDAAGIRRLQGGGLHENPASFYMLMLLILVLARFRRERAWSFVPLILAFGISMVLSFTRITLLAFGLAVLVMELTARGTASTAGRRWITLGTLAGVFLAAAPAALERTSVTVGGDLVSFLSTVSPDSLVRHPEVLNLSGRDVVWNVIWSLFREQPWFGSGMGSTIARLLQYFPPEDVGAPHNEYLRFLADTGLVGTGLIVAAFGGWWAGAQRVLRTTASRRRTDLASATVGAVVAIAVISLSDNPFDYYGSLTQFIALFAAGSLVPEETEPTGAPARVFVGRGMARAAPA